MVKLWVRVSKEVPDWVMLALIVSEINDVWVGWAFHCRARTLGTSASGGVDGGGRGGGNVSSCCLRVGGCR